MSAESSRLVSRTTRTTSLGDRFRYRRLDLLRQIPGVGLLDLLNAHAMELLAYHLFDKPRECSSLQPALGKMYPEFPVYFLVNLDVPASLHDHSLSR
jgi:hypothetical protein